MHQLFVFIRKEFQHILRDRRTMLVLFGMPIVWIILFGFALTTEVKESKIAVLDHSKDEMTQQLLQQIEASKYFMIDRMIQSPSEIESALEGRRIKMVMVLPKDFQYHLNHQNTAQIELITDATDPNLANTVVNYANQIIRNFQERNYPQQELPMTINIESRMLYNPQLVGAYMFVPGVIALILMLICTMMTSVALVKEKELGTMEVILVSPLKKIMFIVSKAIPYFFISLIIVAMILSLSYFVLDVPIKGSLIFLFLESALFIFTCLSLGLLISSVTNSQQVAMLISLMALMLPTIMLSGFMFPIENMPRLLQIISNVVPARWFFTIIKSIMIKGMGIADLLKETAILVGFTIVLMAISIGKFKERLA
jgi:ABC-2 type transport system permease protein